MYIFIKITDKDKKNFCYFQITSNLQLSLLTGKI